MTVTKIARFLFFPPLAVMLSLIPLAAGFLAYATVFLNRQSFAAILSYALAAYTLAVWCLKLPHLIRFFKTVRQKNPYIRIWREDTRLRLNVSLYLTLILNSAYAVFQFGLGFFHRSIWFHSLALYYISLAVMRVFLVRHTKRYKPGENLQKELVQYRTCGIALLVMNLALSFMIFFMVYWNRTFHHHEITTIAMATYTFTSFGMAIYNIAKYRKYNSPVYSASKAISLAAACVSMLTLESTMLTTFGKDTVDLTSRKILLGVSGGVICVFVMLMAVYMIVSGSKALRRLNTEKEQRHG